MNSNPENRQNESKSRRLLFDFWRDVPTIRFMDESFFTIMNQEVRSEILDILREGILDDSVSFKGKTRRRYALNAQELQKHIEERLQREITLSNVYFHIQKLKEIDCVQELVSIREGKYNVAYFSRTAKLFCSSIQDKMRENLNSLRKLFIRLLPSINPTIKKETIMNIFDEIYQYRLERKQLRINWLEKHAELLTDLEFDILIIDKFLMELDGSDTEGSRLYSQISELINY
ncbi:MAG: hypothetical protein ACFFAE_05540 [Candidatus Hodarchaeota archaeon]